MSSISRNEEEESASENVNVSKETIPNPRRTALSKSTYHPVKKNPNTTQNQNAKKASFVIKAACVFEAAAHDINKKLAQEGQLSLETATSIISKYEIASETAKKHFPGAQPSSKVLKIVAAELKKFDISPENTLFAQSVCPDEINHSNGGIAEVFDNFFGDSFYLEGLAGLPFTGLKGFATFTSHVPEGCIL